MFKRFTVIVEKSLYAEEDAEAGTMMAGRFPTEPSLHSHGQPVVSRGKAKTEKEPRPRPPNVDEDSTQAGTPPGPSRGSAGSNVKVRNVSGSPSCSEILGL